jgi:multidrug efflux pump subunit AcrA (membrane-fusion protein)
VSAAQLARLELQLVAVQAEVASAEASVASAEAAHGTQQVAVDQALLALARTEIRTPVAGIVLSRSVEPGTRLTMTSPGPGEAHEAGVARLYDPSRLQVRVDVPLADAAKVGVGTRARIVTEALPDIAFAGVVTRIVHEANIQRNTVQFKVSIENPVPTLKPEMLARVRLLGTDDAADGRAGRESGSESLALLLPESVLIEMTEASAAAWMIGHDARGGTIAVKRRLTIGARHGDGFVEITAGAAATDRAIASPSSAIAEGVRVRVIGELAGTDGDAQ